EEDRRQGEDDIEQPDEQAVERPADEPGEHADRQADRERHRHRGESHAEAGAAAKHDAAEKVASLHVRSEEMLPTRRGKHPAGIVVGAVGGDLGGERCHQDEQDYDGESGCRRGIAPEKAQKMGDAARARGGRPDLIFPSSSGRPVYRGHAFLTISWLRKLYTRVDEGDEKVREEHDRRDAKRHEEHSALDDRIVAVLDRAQYKPPQAGNGENLFKQNRSPDQECGPDTDGRDHRNESVLQRVDEDNPSSRKTLGFRRAHIILAECLDDARPRISQQYGAYAQAKGKRGPEHAGEVREGILEEGYIAQGLDVREIDRAKHYDDGSEKEARRGNTEQRQDPDQDIAG